MFDYKPRFRKIKSLMLENKFDKFLVTSGKDIFYYTGHMMGDDDSAFLIIDKDLDKPLLLLDPLVGKPKSFASVDNFQSLQDVSKLLTGRVGFDERSMSVYTKELLRKSMTNASNIIKSPRVSKDRHEIDEIKRLLHVHAKILDNLRVFGRDEIGVLKDIKRSIFITGLENAFEPIVSSGMNSSIIHYKHTNNRRIGEKDLVILDFGLKKNYSTDITRTLCMNPGKREKKVIEDVTNIQESLIDFLEPGMKMKEVQRKYETLSKRKGYKVYHGFGHGIGLSVHERIETLEPGAVITVEPGVYIKGFGGVRKEDMILIKKDGVEVLSNKI